MFSPEQVQSWRRSIVADPAVRESFSGCKLQSVRLDLSLPDKEPHANRITAGRLRAPAKIFGDPIDPRCVAGLGNWDVHIKTDALLDLSDAMIIGNSAVLTEINDLLTPFRSNSVDVETFVAENAFGHQGFLFEPDGVGVTLYTQVDREFLYLDATALFISNIEPGNYGSFFFRMLPQLLAIAAQAPQYDYYIVPERTSFFFEAIQILGLPQKPAFEVREVAGLRLRRVLMCQLDDAEAFLSPDACQGLSALARHSAAALNDEPSPERIYVSRRLSAARRPWYRVIENELALEKTAENAGFTIIYPETLSLHQQLRTFARAKYVVGPSGSGMFNVGFSGNLKRVVDIETYHVTVRQHGKFYSSLKADYAFLFAKFVDQAPTDSVTAPSICDLALFKEALEWLTGP